MARILFLAHRIPYPPDKGDKIRSWHMLAHLARDHQVHLGCFVDDPDDRRHLSFLSEVCEEIHAVDLDPRTARLRSLTGLLKGEALSCGYYADRDMAVWVDRVLKRYRFDGTIVFSSPMASYVLGRKPETGRLIMDFVDIDSDKWRQYAASKPWPVSMIYAREHRRLLDFERRVAGAADASLFVSPREAELFRTLAPDAASRTGHLNNGVDSVYFSPDHDLENPYHDQDQAMVFTGAMDYWANVDAVQWFADHVLPGVRAQHPHAVFYIVGGKPTAAVKALGARDGIVVTGRVTDVRPFVKHAAVVVCPLRIARGVQNKVLEGMAMAKTVVATPEAFEGIDAVPGQDLMVTEGPEAFGAAVAKVLAQDGDAAMGARARARVKENYAWSRNMAVLDDLLFRARAHV